MTLWKPSQTNKIGVPPEIVLVTLGRPTRQAAVPVALAA